MGFCGAAPYLTPRGGPSGMTGEGATLVWDTDAGASAIVGTRPCFVGPPLLPRRWGMGGQGRHRWVRSEGARPVKLPLRQSQSGTHVVAAVGHEELVDALLLEVADPERPRGGAQPRDTRANAHPVDGTCSPHATHQANGNYAQHHARPHRTKKLSAAAQ